ncbi:MAG: alpha/beta hydrolase family protein [Pseudomonadota bacterium]
MGKTFVLLHGAWHGGWCWAEVAEILRARGHRVTTPTQTGLGERRHLISRDVTVETFIDDLANHILAEDLRDVTLVGHSFGGMATSGTAERMPERLSEVVYLDCTMVRGGECMADNLPASTVTERIRAAKASDGVSVPPPPVSVFGVTEPEVAARLQARLTPHPLNTMLTPLPITGLPGNGLPARYIRAADPAYHTRERVEGWCAEFGFTLQEIAACHDAMVTAPKALADLLET